MDSVSKDKVSEDSALKDRVSGVLLGQACGDALGVPYEFVFPPTTSPLMVGGGLGPYKPGEWSDDTQMALCIASVTAQGKDLRLRDNLDEVALNFEVWAARGATDIGIQTSRVLKDSIDFNGSPSERLQLAALLYTQMNERATGNGALMRTGILGVVAVNDRDVTSEIARSVASLTHADVLAGDSCVLWCEAIRLAVTQEVLDLKSGLDLIPSERQGFWEDAINEAENEYSTVDFGVGNGYTVTALQAAWRAIRLSSYFSETSFNQLDSMNHFSDSLKRAVCFGGDTDTIAAITGALVGARHGLSMINPTWMGQVNGWPGYTAVDLVTLALNSFSE